MTSRSYPSWKLPQAKQRGVALAISLILLVVLTLLGLSSVKTLSSQGKMISQTYDRSLAYQFAEAALREGEGQARIQALGANASFPATQYLQDNVCAPASITDCVNGLCSAPDPDCTPRWENAAFTANNSALWTNYNGVNAIISQSGNILMGAAGVSAPQYFIEILRPVGTVAIGQCAANGSMTFDERCNRRYPNPDDPLPCVNALSSPPPASTPSPTVGINQYCYYYRYRITARVQIPGRAAIVLQSIYSIEPQ